MKKRTVSILLSLLLLTAAAFGYAEGTFPVSAETAADPVCAEFQLDAGDQIFLKGFFRPESFTRDFSFHSSDESVAAVSGKGILSAVSCGEAVVTMLSGRQSQKVHVTVTAPPVPPHINVPCLAMIPGETQSLHFENAPGPSVWMSDNPGAVTTDSSGTVTAVGPGTARITAASGGYRDSITVVVTDRQPYPPLTEIRTPRYSEEDGILRNPESAPASEASIILTGDLMALSAQQAAAKAGNTYNFNSSFDLVRPVFQSADFVMGNLETCLSYSSPYTIESKTVQGNPHCNAPATYLDALRHAGYDAVATANNHSGDTGLSGLCETVRMLDIYQLAHTGTYTQDSQQRFLLAEIRGITVAFLSYTELLNRKYGELALPENLKPQLLGEYSAARVREDVEAARAAGAEYIIAFNHWGKENTHALTQIQTQHAQELADAGVDFIAGSHSHCLQPAAWITAADGREVPCIYSMGNFVSSMPRDINNDTVILRLDLQRSGQKVVLKKAGYIPCHVFPSYNGGHHVIVPLDGRASGVAAAGASQRIEGILGNSRMVNLLQDPQNAYRDGTC